MPLCTPDSEATPPPASLRLHCVTYGAEGVLLFDLRADDGRPLVRFTPGAHIDVEIPQGMRRSYSLLNDPSERHRYVIGVQKEAAGRGGSRWMHEHARVGASLAIHGPRNHFPLEEAAAHSVFIAGGIGITPIWSMIQRLRTLGRQWSLHYSCRSRATAALLEELIVSTDADQVALNFDDTSGTHLDLRAIVASAPDNSHFYCCGPAPMLNAFKAACEGLPQERVHLEYFGAAEAPATQGGFTVKLARKGVQVIVPTGRTILEALRSAGVAVPSSCEQGVCGICETRVLAGVPDHRDLVLTEAERAANQSVMICCSGARTPELTLDL